MAPLVLPTGQGSTALSQSSLFSPLFTPTVILVNLGLGVPRKGAGRLDHTSTAFPSNSKVKTIREATSQYKRGQLLLNTFCFKFCGIFTSWLLLPKADRAHADCLFSLLETNRCSWQGPAWSGEGQNFHFNKTTPPPSLVTVSWTK